MTRLALYYGPKSYASHITHCTVDVIRSLNDVNLGNPKMLNTTTAPKFPVSMQMASVYTGICRHVENSTFRLERYQRCNEHERTLYSVLYVYCMF